MVPWNVSNNPRNPKGNEMEDHVARLQISYNRIMEIDAEKTRLNKERDELETTMQTVVKAIVGDNREHEYDDEGVVVSVCP